MITLGIAQLQLGSQLAISLIQMLRGIIQRNASQNAIDEGTMLDQAEQRTIENLEANKKLAEKLASTTGVSGLLANSISSIWRAQNELTQDEAFQEFVPDLGEILTNPPETQVKLLLKELKKIRPDLFEGV